MFYVYKKDFSDFAEEFLGQPAINLGPINSFNMKSLLREIQPAKVEQRRSEKLQVIGFENIE